jgi:sugar phosphate isomerase/epimerase
MHMSTPIPIALQLYSLRDAAALDYRSVLERVARAGFIGIEYANLHGHEPRTVRGWAEDMGLVGVSAHRPLPIGDAANEILDGLAELGVDTLVVPWAPAERFADLASIGGLAEDLLRAQQNAAGRGVAVGYHNHEFELASVIDGRTGLEHLFDAVGPSVFAEVDVYWARVGGVDPAVLIARMGPLVRLLHLKDGPADVKTSPHVAVGSGVIDFHSIAAASQHVAWDIVELDACATDMFEAVEASQRWLVGQGLARGRA